jgi:hypothetical protein
VDSPSGYNVTSAGPSRVILAHRTAPIQIAIYKVEFGNLGELTAAHEARLVQTLRSRLGPGGDVSIGPARLGGESGRAIRLAGRRNGANYTLHAVWHFRGGQAWVVECLSPDSLRAQADEAHSVVVRSFVWIKPDRG